MNAPTIHWLYRLQAGVVTVRVYSDRSGVRAFCGELEFEQPEFDRIVLALRGRPGWEFGPEDHGAR